MKTIRWFVVLYGIVVVSGVGVRAATDASPFGMLSADQRHAPAMGVQWNRGLCFYWPEVQPDPEQDALTWSKPLKGGGTYDEMVREQGERFQLYGEVSSGVPGKHKAHLQPGSYAPKDEEAFATFVRATVERYDGDGLKDLPGLPRPIRHWEIQNEPVFGEDYARVLSTAYRAIKEADPDAIVHIGGTYGTPEEAFEYLDKVHRRALRELKGEPCFDVFDVHWYGNAFGDYKKLEKFLRYIRNMLEETGYDPNAPIWLSEVSTYSGTHAIKKGKGRSPYQSESLQAADYLKRHLYSLGLGVEKVFVACALFDGQWDDTDGYFNHTGMLRAGDQSKKGGKGKAQAGEGGASKRGDDEALKKKAYETYRLMTDKLEGSDWSSLATVRDGKNGVFAYRIDNPVRGKTVWVVWWDWFDDATGERREKPERREKDLREKPDGKLRKKPDRPDELRKVSDDALAFPAGASTSVALPLAEGRAVMTEAVADDLGMRGSRTVDVDETPFTVKLGEHPVFIEQDLNAD